MAKDSEIDHRLRAPVSDDLPPKSKSKDSASDANTSSTRTRFFALVVCLAAVALPSWLSITSSFQVTRLQNRVDSLEERLRVHMQDFVDDLVERVRMKEF